MITPTDPLAAMKKSSPGDPIIPAFEHINRHLETMRNHAQNIALDAAYLRNTRNIIFLIACLVSSACGGAGTWYFMRGNPSPDIQILQHAGVEVLITDANDKVSIAFLGRHPTPTVIPPNNGLILTWTKQQ